MNIHVLSLSVQKNKNKLEQIESQIIKDISVPHKLLVAPWIISIDIFGPGLSFFMHILRLFTKIVLSCINLGLSV